ncbi:MULTISPECIES: maltokinase N-terminal cap-like domain-containing protein [Pseudonocardia]|uniref:Maltokinase n=2 Tax=Pseudonocardia TaxID=1847 RepID=A0A1Y2N8K5_PSEAH|nr:MULTISPECIES: phosphotransferase [Pseudonocardia]OSY43531.1 Maltokinase [Pseudonocardia autotrophica]TDN73477.1 maltokinase [Pseudonocardia autotrophica]BBG04218.1 maltokinase [Pseudonocardia autotrophica]GEC29144.1 maltokinase [Pseudonocardia saturnea]
MGPTGASDHLSALPDLLRGWLPGRRWFAEKGRPLQSVRIAARTELPAPGELLGLDVLVLAVSFADGPDRYYQLHLARRAGSGSGFGTAVIAERDDVVLYDGLHDPAVTGWLLGAIATGRTVHDLAFVPEPGVVLPTGETGTVVDAEQSNTSVRWGERSILKIYRRLSPGPNPDLELHRALRTAGVGSVAALQGAIEGTLDGEPTTYGLLQEFAAGSQDGWERAVLAVRDGRDFTADAHALGGALAEVHLALRDELGAGESDPVAMAGYWTSRLETVAAQVPVLAPHVPAIRAVYDEVAALGEPVVVQRVHGDLHLGQTLRTPGDDWLIIDFEGEPAATPAERRAPDAAVRDVVGMLFSFEYAAFHHLLSSSDTPGGGLGSDTPQSRAAHAWSTANRDAFCAGYAARTGTDPRTQDALLRAFELDKAVYQVIYETRSRPTWLPIPLTAIARTTTGPTA